MTPITVQTSHGVMTARHVIVAVPNGVIKYHHIRFNPPLPLPVSHYVNALDAGLMDVVVLRFEEQFWPSDVFVFGIPPDREVSATASPLSNHSGLSDIMRDRIQWKMGLRKGGDSCAVTSEGLEEDFGGVPPDSLFSSFMNLTMARKDTCPLLLGQVYGRRALQLETMSPGEVAGIAHESLKMIFGLDIPKPIGCFFHKWGLDEWAYGSWNSLKVGADTKDLYDFKSPVYCQSVHNRSCSCLQFAGEWTDPSKMGLLQGAYATGERAADHILSQHPRSNNH